MPNNLLASGVYGCVFIPAYKCNGRIVNKKKKIVSKLTKDDFTSRTEIDISNRVKGIPNYRNYFIVVESSCPIKRKNMRKSSMIEQCDLMKKNTELKHSYVLLYSNYIKSLELADYLETNNSITIYDIMKIFIDIRERVDMMTKYKIVHNDLHFGNILRSKETGNIYIIDFGLSICTENYYKNGELDYHYLKDVIFNYSPSWNWWTLEYHLLGYLIHVGELSDKTIRDTVREYMDNHRIIPQISPEFGKEFERRSIQYFLKYSKMGREETIKELLSFSHTWDYYKIALHFLKTLQVYHFNNDTLKMFLINLINPNPEKRPSMLEQHRMVSQLIQFMPVIKESKPFKPPEV
jgi:tRNA A-37 threonylcarbamoyl transferase component Bud32